jgi:glycosyltransferase involved in cell wall biosynthesis
MDRNLCRTQRIDRTNMRIVVSALPTAPGGGLTLMRDLLESWQADDELLVLAWRPSTVDALRETGHTVIPVKARTTPEAVARLWRLPDVVCQFRPDVVWSQAVRLSWAAIPQAVHWQDIGSFEAVHRPSIRRRVRRLRESSDLRRADVRVFNSHAIHIAAMKAHPGITQLQNVVVPNGLRLESFFVAGNRPPTNDGTLRILLPQSDSPHKRNALAAEVIARVARRLPPKYLKIRLIIPGTGAFEDVQRVLAREGLEELLDLRGALSRSRMSDLYAESNVVLITSRGESFCNPAVEAAAAGRWLVAPPLPVLSETGGPMALLAPSADPDDLADGVLQVAAHEPDDVVRERAQAHAKGFTADSCAGALRSVLEGMR